MAGWKLRLFLANTELPFSGKGAEGAVGTGGLCASSQGQEQAGAGTQVPRQLHQQSSAQPQLAGPE